MRIDARFNGPPTSGNGGWSAGSFAVAAGAAGPGVPFEVTLRLPPPLETDLAVADGKVTHGSTLVAEIRAGGEAGDGVPGVDLSVATAAARDYAGFADRKATVDSSVYAPDGARLATARATWIAVR